MRGAFQRSLLLGLAVGLAACKRDAPSPTPAAPADTGADREAGSSAAAAESAGPLARLADVNPGSTASYPLELARVGSKVVFTADDGVHKTRFWATDGTPAGTALLTPPLALDGHLAITSKAVVGRTLYFTFVDHGAHGAELWKTDGTGPGTVMVKDIWPGAPGSFPQDLTAAGDRLFFTADDGTHGRELWVSDGTDAGTYLVKEIVEGGSEPADPKGFSRGYAVKPVNLLGAGGRVFFDLFDAKLSPLWVSDGTPGGTREVFRGKRQPSTVRPWAFAGDVLYAEAELDGVDGIITLFRSDGTTKGTTVVTTFGKKEDRLRTRLTNATAVVGSTLHFVVTDELAFRDDDKLKVGACGLWKTDGTKAGTVRLTKMTPSRLVVHRGAIYFDHRKALYRTGGAPGDVTKVKDFESQLDDVVATESALFVAEGKRSTTWRLWKSDGTDAGTVVLGSFGEDPRLGGNAFATSQPMIVLGERVVFAASQPSTDMEIWSAR